jgi:hypothetical protein
MRGADTGQAEVGALLIAEAFAALRALAGATE